MGDEEKGAVRIRERVFVGTSPLGVDANRKGYGESRLDLANFEGIRKNAITAVRKRSCADKQKSPTLPKKGRVGAIKGWELLN